jgi:malonate transporter and related proteins
VFASLLDTAALLAPDFSLVILGYLLMRYTLFKREAWTVLEQLVYYVLFPVLLFNAVSNAKFDFATTAGFLASGLALASFAIAAGYSARWLLNPDATLYASGVQTAFRFNSYIGLAVAERLAGAEGVSLLGLLIGFCVPIFNVASVYPLAKHSERSIVGEIIRNPLIIATVSGLLANFAGFSLPPLLAPAAERMGSAAILLGLMAVGAGLQIGELRQGGATTLILGGYFLVVKHLLKPLAALALALLVPLPALQAVLLVLFASLPTASSAYVLAARMGGNAAFVAALVTISTIVSVASITVFVALTRSLSQA